MKLTVNRPREKMEIQFLRTISLPLSSEKDLSCCSTTGDFLAFSTTIKKGLFLRSVQENSEQDDKNLTCEHKSPIHFICFGQKDPNIMVTASTDKIVLWTSYQALFEDPLCKVIGKDLGQPNHLAFSFDDKQVICCISNEIWIIDVKSCILTAQLESESQIINAQYSPVFDDMLVSLEENKTYSIWDLKNQEKIYQSTIVSAYGFTSLSMHHYQSFFATGSSDGLVRVFDLTLHKSIHQVSIEQLLLKEDASKLSHDDIGVKTIIYWNRELAKEATKSRIENWQELYLAVGCASYLFIYNANSMEQLFCLSFFDLDGPIRSFPSAKIITFSPTEDFEELTTVIVESNNVHVLRVVCDSEDLAINLSFLSIEPLMEKSPLKSDMIPKSKPKIVKKKVGLKKKSDKMNQPIVFNSKVSSSGYTKDKPRSHMFTPNINKKKKKASTKTPVGPWGLKTQARKIIEDYPMKSEPPINHVDDFQLTEKPTSINDINFSDSGKSLFCALSDHTFLMINPDKPKNISTFTGHNGCVTSVSMGHSNSLIISSSFDSTIKLWKPSLPDPILDITHQKHNFNQDKLNPTAQKDNSKFSKGITKAMFYFVDKFILLSHGNTLSLYKFYIEPSKDEIKRYQSNNKYKVVKEFNITDAQKITSFSAINSFYSYTSICACSNRALVFFDMNRGEEIHKIHDAHNRPVHSVCQNQGSSFACLPRESYDLFATAAPCDGVKLWDMRTMKCVIRFEGHINRAHKVGLAYSPCSRFIAVGSEDRATYIYDVRSNSYLHSLPGHTDTVSSVAFNPKKPLLACASLTGKLKLYEAPVV